MTNVIHISDTHIVPDGYLVADRLNTVQQLHKLVKYLIEHAPEYGPIDALILSGDVSDDGSLEHSIFELSLTFNIFTFNFKHFIVSYNLFQAGN